MGCTNIFFITLTVCVVMRVSFSQGIQRDKSRYSVRTILSTMNSDFTSPYGNCSFPPKEVLNSPDLNTSPTFGDLDSCDRKMPTLDAMKPVSDSGTIMCLGLLELGLRLCSLKESYFKNNELVSIPRDKESYSSLILKLKVENDPNLCTNLKEGLNLAPIDEQLPLGVLKKWSLQSVFHEREESCSRICFDYTNNPLLLCKLISWGYNNVLTQSDPKPFQPLTHSVKGNVDAVAGSVTNHDESEKTEGLVLNQNVPDDHKSEYVNGDKISEFEIGTGNGNIPSSSEVTPIDGTKTDLKLVESKTPEAKNEGVATKQNADSTKSDPNQNEPHSVSSLVDGTKHLESGAEHSTTSNKQEVIKGNPDKSQTTDVKIPSDGDNSKDFDFEEKPSEKIPIDGAGKGDEVRDPFDPTLTQDDDDDDDLNVPDELDHNSNNAESTGYKTDTADRPKYSQDVFSNSNTGTFIQERYEDPEDSHFFSYFMAMVVFCIVGYVVFHNKQKILALALEGRSRRTPRRRSATANYHKLDNNLEEAVSSPCNTSVTHVIY